MRVLAVIAPLLCISTAAYGAAIPVASCGAVVQGTGYLTADLDCSAYPGNAVTLVGGSRLRLNGFTLTASTGAEVPSLAAVDCIADGSPKPKLCKIKGPGNIVGGTIGIQGGLRTRVSRVNVSNALEYGISAGRTRVVRSVIQGNGLSSFNHGGLICAELVLQRSTVTGNGGFGTRASVTRLVRSHVTGNGFAPDCGPEPSTCADLLSINPPRVRAGSTCGTSKRMNGVTHGVCSGD